jgi:hypothetical protein
VLGFDSAPPVRLFPYPFARLARSLGKAKGGYRVSILWIILIIVLVLLLLGFFSRGRW